MSLRHIINLGCAPNWTPIVTDSPRSPANTGAKHARDSKGRWRRGKSGNPKGSAKGSRHRASLAVEALLEDEADGLTRKAIELALDGDTVALRLCLDRICPPRKDRPVQVSLPKMETVADLPKLTGALFQQVANGALTPSEAAEVSKLIEGHRRAIETADIEERLSRLEGVG